MNNNNDLFVIIVSAVSGIVAAIGTALVGWSGILGVLFNRHKEESENKIQVKHESTMASDLIIKESLALVDVLSKQVKDLRSDNRNVEQELTRENQVLRDRIRLLEQRVSDIELKYSEKDIENARLKSRIYDLEKAAT